MTIEELAQQGLDLLAEQKAYFKTKEVSQLNKCKQLESQFRKACEQVLGLNKEGKTLFE